MEINTIKENDKEIAIIKSDDILIRNVQSALDFMATVSYETGSSHIILNKSAIIEEFFDLRTKLAGEILQKFVIYHMKLAIVGDFSILPTYRGKHNIIHFAAHKKHIGLYPGDKAIEYFKVCLSEYKTSKGVVQFPYDKPLPLELIAEIAELCYETGNHH